MPSGPPDSPLNRGVPGSRGHQESHPRAIQVIASVEQPSGNPLRRRIELLIRHVPVGRDDRGAAVEPTGTSNDLRMARHN
jgi:hypothetical protein